MPQVLDTTTQHPGKSWVDRALSLFTEVRAGEGATAVLMLANIFLLLICYSVIKTVREPLILLGGGAEVRSYAAAGQALLLMGFVPLYSWFASRVDRVRLLVGVTTFFIVCIELFASAVSARVPYIGVAFFIWVGIFNISLVAQFWSFANDLYSKDAGSRLFPIIVVGMTAGAPLGSLIAGRLFGLGMSPQVILQVSAVLLAVSMALYLLINAREHAVQPGVRAEPLAAGNGFKLVLSSRYLTLIALLVVLLNVVNTTGEYLIAKLLTTHVKELAMADPNFNKQAFIGAFTGNYQFWVNVTAFLLQAFVTSRLVKFAGLRGALLALPLIALGGYAIIAAGAGFSIVRWIKTAENATDYSVMNTARQLLWLPTSREEKYKAKQAIDTFFVRTGDLLSAAVVFAGTALLQLDFRQFAIVNVVLTLAWIGIALMILVPRRERSNSASTGSSTVAKGFGPALKGCAAAAVMLLLAVPALAQETREEFLAAQKAEKATDLHPYTPTALEQRIAWVERKMFTPHTFYPYMGSVIDGGGAAFGPGYRARFGDTGSFNAHAAWSVRNFKALEATLKVPAIARGRVSTELRGSWADAPSMSFYGIGGTSRKIDHVHFQYRATTVGVSTKMRAARFFSVGGGVDYVDYETGLESNPSLAALNPAYTRSNVFAEVDSRTSPDYTRRGGLYRVEVSNYSQMNAGNASFRRFDAEVRQFVPLLRENWVIGLRALASTTDTANGESVPYFLLPELGGSHMLRGYSAWRFRDRNRLLFSGEYRWTAGPFVDMTAFVEAGKVTARPADLNLKDLKATGGFGFAVHTPRATVARIELARGSEGTRVLFSFSPSF